MNQAHPNRFRSHAWQVFLGRLVLLLIVAMILGLSFDLLWQAIAIALAAQVSWSLYALAKIDTWLQSRRLAQMPEDLGVISEMARNLDRRFRTERAQKRRVINLLRAFREAAAALPDGVVVLSSGRAIIWLNESASRILPARLPRDRGRLLDDFFVSEPLRQRLDNQPEKEPLLYIAEPNNAEQK